MGQALEMGVIGRVCLGLECARSYWRLGADLSRLGPIDPSGHPFPLARALVNVNQWKIET